MRKHILNAIQAHAAAEHPKECSGLLLLIDGKVPDPTGGATHYYAVSIKKPPAWAAKAKQTLKLGRHIFFKDLA
jgi:proteasome lid subunit RPN8/RPN11